MIVNIIKKKVTSLQDVVCQQYSSHTPTAIIMVNKLSKDPVGGLDSLLMFLLIRKMQQNWAANYIDGLIYEALIKQPPCRIKNVLTNTFGSGIVLLRSQKNIDYLPLQELLIHKQFQAANALTHDKLRELSSLYHGERSWLYFTDISSLPVIDLHTIDNLWRTHSLNKFGFSIQRQIWLAGNKDWNKLWNTIGWKIDHVLCRYPNDFQWDISGPIGHLPLFNQLYGVQPMLALFKHKAWKC
uniref:GUN4-like domain-containing protein n=1 Tax=Hildenbrandia rubra TaxID=31481 RepID=A0A1C9CG48_9FLOR|nr:hypothetical protein Hrub_098 [Hildenbrandia rubra]AOM67342.1 hypothetical protein Hrub_098 [Hildenbrandia rubra]